MLSPAGDATVVVPTHDRPASLKRCLGALESQRNVGELEIVVVDDGSADARSVERVVASSPRARLLRLEGVGPATARNRGAEAGQASMVLFTDDDCEPAPDWVARLIAVLGAGADAAQGRTVNGLHDNPFAEASQVIADHLVEKSLTEPGQPPFATSNNLACTRETITAPPFDTRYRGAGGEDRDWCARLAASGSTLVRDPEAVVVHRHELGPRSFWRQHVAYGRGAQRFRHAHPEAGAREPAGFYLDLLRSALGRGAAVGALTAVAQVATAAGYARSATGGERSERY